MPAPIVSKILDALNRDVLNQLELAKAVTHPGESGRAREQIVADYLRRIIPEDFRIDTGFVIDGQGGVSRQIDLVVYRRNYHPVFQIGGIKYFMIESVAAVIENKASIASRDVFKAALENIRSVKVLDRSNGGHNYVLAGGRQAGPVDPGKFEHQVFGAVVTEQSLTRDALKDEWIAFLKAYPSRTDWPNFYADVRHFAGLYMSSLDPPAMTVIPSKAICLALTDEDDLARPPLLELTFELVNLLRISELIDFSPRGYLWAESGKVQWWKIEP